MTFSGYFHELHGHDPFPWQEDLAVRVCREGWPPVIDLPTASGKTACIDIAVFALCAAERQPRRVFFVVDRRIIVDEAFDRAQRIASAIAGATDGPLAEAAARLRAIAGSDQPLHAFQLRGGIYRDESWMRSPRQPAIVTGTVDQIGSRLLFRGYGVRDYSQPLHAAMIGNDALILLDEAHCSRPFAQTLARVERYRQPRWSQRDLAKPFRFVQMTATPDGPVGEAPFAITERDRAHPVLARRLAAPKPAKLAAVKAKSDDAAKMAAAMVSEAKAIVAADPAIKRVAIMVNRVATARAVFDKLEATDKHLLIGRMRPLDRDLVVGKLDGLKSDKPRDNDTLTFVVATQCLEVGADLDFDALVTECASMDALLQRFGRLDRLGNFGRARATIMLPATDAKRPDPVYGEALAYTRQWLEQLAASGSELDFGLESSPGSIPQVWRALDPGDKESMTPAAPIVPALLPSHLDTLVQTSPRPVPEPAVSFFLHGCEPTDVDVQVVIRSDLSQDIDQWAGIAKLCPPTSAEALPVRLWIFREWMAGEKSPPVDADTEGAIKHAPSRSEDETHVVLWNDGEPELVWSPAKIYPGAMVIIPASSRVDALGYIPADAVNDIADAAFLETKRRVQLRLHPAFELLPAKLADLAKLTDIDPGDLKAKAEVCLEASALPAWLSEPLQVIAKAKSIDIERYPDNSGFVVRTRRRHRPDDSWEEDGAADERSGGEEVLLTDHTQHVVEATERNANALVDDDHAQTLFRAAELHDAGKAHLDFQIFLRRGDKLTAAFAPPIAKGTSRGGPSPFRHEMLSTIHAALRTPNGADRDLLLHLIASHHGRCRPFAPVEADAAARFTFDGFTVSAAECAEHAPHRLCNGAAERFWRLTRLYGWWGLAYLEAMLRLGDWEASASEQERTDA